MRPKAVIRDILHHLQTAFRPEILILGGLSPVVQLIELLRSQMEEPPKRQFLKVKFTSNAARDLQLRSVLRDPQVFMSHPEPEKAAAIMLVESFNPQIQSFLFNYTEAAVEMNIESAAADCLENCACRQCFTSFCSEDMGPDGHVCTFDTRNLKWGYLSELTKKGKKFRLPSSSEAVLKELDEAIEG